MGKMEKAGTVVCFRPGLVDLCSLYIYLPCSVFRLPVAVNGVSTCVLRQTTTTTTMTMWSVIPLQSIMVSPVAQSTIRPAAELSLEIFGDVYFCFSQHVPAFCVSNTSNNNAGGSVRAECNVECCWLICCLISYN
jgi:hypothetical protein